MDQEFENLRREVARRDRGRGRRYPQSLRDRVARWARGRRQRGAGWLKLAGEIGIAAESLRRWTTRDESSPAMVPIRVVEEVDRVDAERRLRLITPAGHRIEALTIAEVIALVRSLG